MATSLMSDHGKSYIEILLAGDRVNARKYVTNALGAGQIGQILHQYPLYTLI